MSSLMTPNFGTGPSDLCQGCSEINRDCVCEICEICDESVTYCTCWRCADCEELFLESVEAELNEDHETFCQVCKNGEFF